ncbi:SGNH/GDSL hydrolase family protein [Marinilactibacillus psychrotolerans]
MNNYIAEHTDELEVQNAVYPESDTYELYIEQTTTNVVAMEPDIIVYRMPALADKVRDIGLSETNDYLSSILTTLMDSLPDTEIILVEPEPVLSEMENLNSRSLDYRSYMNEMKEVANDMEIQVISTHEQFINIAEEEGFELAELYKEDETSLNENGLIILQQAIERGLTTKTEE